MCECTDNHKTSSNWDNFIVEMLFYDLRNINDSKKVEELFTSKMQLPKFEDSVKLLSLFKKCQCDVEILKKELNKLFKTHGRTDIKFELFYEMFLSLPNSGVTSMDEFFKRVKTCGCKLQPHVDDKEHRRTCSLLNHDKLAKFSDLFFEKDFKSEIKKVFDSWSSYCINNNTFWNCVKIYNGVCASVTQCHAHVMNIVNKTVYDSLTSVKRRNFHVCLAEVCSFNFYTIQGVTDIRNYLKENANKIGVYYYARLMHILSAIGWYGIKKYLDEFLSIANEETDWKNDKEEVSEFQNLSINLLATTNKSDRENVLGNLKILSKFFRLSDYFQLMCIFWNPGMLNENDTSYFKVFFDKLESVIYYTRENCFKN